MSPSSRLPWAATLTIVAVALALAGLPGGAAAEPPPGAASVQRTAGGGSRVTVPLPNRVPVRDAAPLVLNGDTPLGFGKVAADRRTVVLQTRMPVGSAAAVRVVWSGGGIPAPEHARATATRPTTPPGAALDGRIAPAPTEQLPAAVGDPGVKGPLATVRGQYTLGDTALKVPTGYRTEVTGEVTSPATLGTRKHPVVVLLHGRHDFCGRRDGRTDYTWPCRTGYRRIPSEQGYRALADLLASHGNVVVSVAANGINAGDDAAVDGGARDRGFLVMHHLNLWRGWSSTDLKGPFGARFRGALDLTRVGLMGHSRGGEGVVAALAENRRTGSKFQIRAVAPLAPVNFTRQSVRGTASMTLVPYCDGDVSDLQGVHFFDDATAGSVDAAPHALLGVLGANHNFFNTVWTPGGWEAGTVDDWFDRKNPLCGADNPASRRLTAPQQVAAGTAYLAAFLRARLQGRTGYDALFRGNTATPGSASPARTVAAWSARAGGRLILHDLRADGSNALGGATRATGFDSALRCGGDTRYATTCIAPRGTGDEPHLSRSWSAPQAHGLSQLHLVWSKAGPAWSNALPVAHRDLTGYRYVTVRLAKDAWAFSATPPAMGLRLRDSAGKVSTVRLAGAALDTPVFTGPTGSGDPTAVPHALVMAVPVPLSRFSAVDLRRVQSVTLVTLGASGDLTVGDVSFQK